MSTTILAGTNTCTSGAAVEIEGAAAGALSWLLNCPPPC